MTTAGDTTGSPATCPNLRAEAVVIEGTSGYELGAYQCQRQRNHTGDCNYGDGKDQS